MACRDGGIYIYNSNIHHSTTVTPRKRVSVMRDYSARATCFGAAGAVTHVDWSADGAWLQANSEALELLHFSAADGQPTDPAVCANQGWASYTTPLGW